MIFLTILPSDAILNTKLRRYPINLPIRVRNSRKMLIYAARTTPLCGQGTARLAVRFLASSALCLSKRFSRARRIRSPGFPQGLLTPPVTCENGCKFRRHGVMGGRTLRMYNMNKGHSLTPPPPLWALLATPSHSRKNV